MSTFTALNLEPEESFEQEVDDSREIQIEEALKLYQNALKLHSQGPDFAVEAAAAYEALFQSEIFRYPEAASEFVNEQDNPLSGVRESAPLLPTSAVDVSPNSFLQVIYLSYKNYGQFVLDTLRFRVSQSPELNSDSQKQKLFWVETGGRALENFAQALERDDSDLDLWRRAARIGGVLASHRLVRFCLESVLVTDEQNSYEVSDLLGLDELAAFEDLKKELKLLADDLSLYQTPKATSKVSLAAAIRHRMDPYSFLPTQTRLEYPDERQRPSSIVTKRKTIYAPSKTWTAVGMEIYRALLEEQKAGLLWPCAALRIEVPGEPSPIPDDLTETMDVDGMEDSSSKSPPAAGLAVEDATSRPILGNSAAPAAGSPSHSRDGTPDNIDDQLHAQLNGGFVESTEVPADGLNAPDGTKPGNSVSVEAQATSLPSRKRNSMTAGNEDPAETGRVKSKRLRARESMVEALVQEEEVTIDQSRYVEDQLIELSQADDIVFTMVEQILDSLHVHEMIHLKQFRDVQSKAVGEDSQETFDKSPVVLAMLDFQTAMNSWTEEKGQAFLIGDGTIDLDGVGNSKDVGLALFQEHTKPALPTNATNMIFQEEDGLDPFLKSINSSWCHLHVSALRWLEELLLPSIRKRHKSKFGRMSTVRSSYIVAKWLPSLKDLVVNLLVTHDEFLTQIMEDRIEDMERRLLHSKGEKDVALNNSEFQFAEMAQAIFELHLDIYCAITNPSSVVDRVTRLKQKDRLHRWNNIANTFVTHHSKNLNIDLTDGLVVRFLFAATLHAIKAEDAQREHIMLCLKDLQRLLNSSKDLIIFLPNNAVMPEISATSVGQEMSRLSTLDFFMAMFNSDDSDPVKVIEGLEPLLEYSAGISRNLEDEEESDIVPDVVIASEKSLPSQAQELVSFLEQGDASLTLFLWRKLRDAYKSIDYTPKIVSCSLRSLEVVMKQITSKSHSEKSNEARQLSLLKWLKYLDDLIAKLVAIVLNTPNAFECIDSTHLEDSLSAVLRLVFVLHAFACYDDSIRIGQIHAPPLKSASANRAFEKVKDKLRETQVRLWILLYTMIRDGMSQNKESFPNPTEDRANYLRFVHNSMGLRGYCKYSSKGFLKLMKQEFIEMKSWQENESDFAQLLFDLYGLRFGYGIGDFDHSCTSENLDKKTANTIIAFVMSLARRMNIKDLLKSDLRGTLEKMQHVMGSYKTSPSVSFNKRIINHYLKSSINPTDLFNSLKGIGDLPTKPVKTDTAAIAATGWYFLQGHLALSRFKSIKRVNQTATDELDTAMTFFRQDLDHDIEQWETWYRLAQVYDLKIDDDLMWTAEKVNNHRGELATFQRNAIHCYSMAVATSLRSANISPEESDKISDMFTEFAIRLYSSSREPLSMQAFSLENLERHFSNEATASMYKAKPFSEMKPYTVWNLAAHLLRRALVDQPKKWINYYYLGKCLWKMFCYTGDARAIRTKPGVDDLLEVHTEAIENLPEKKDSRGDPILEPHFKLVSLVYKLVRMRMLEPARASELLQVSKWAKKAHLSEDEDGWEPYILQILKFLGQADKSNWHHRIPLRAAHVIYDDNERDLAAALGAKHELTQNIFTKTMTLQVWKPENERAGRHFVYTTRYVSFFIRILYQLNDRTNLDMLARRIRRKPSDYLNHGKLWDAVCGTYLALLRKIGKLQLGSDEIVFKSMTSEEFAKRAEKIEPWAQDKDTACSALDILRDALELKKLNNSLMKGSGFDDLIADAYTKIYETYYQQHPEEDQPEAPTATNGQPLTFLTSTVPGQSLPTQFDGTGESPSAALSNAPSSAPTPPHPAKPVRIKPVSRREIIRKAEAIAAARAAQLQQPNPKPSATPTPGKALRPVIEIRTSSAASTTANPLGMSSQSPTKYSSTRSGPRSASPNKTAVMSKVDADESTQQSPSNGADEEADADDEQDTKTAAEDNDNDDADASASGSGSGSELSDLDEEEEMNLERNLFPSLIVAAAPSKPKSKPLSRKKEGIDDSAEGSEPGEEDEAEENDGDETLGNEEDQGLDPDNDETEDEEEEEEEVEVEQHVDDEEEEEEDGGEGPEEDNESEGEGEGDVEDVNGEGPEPEPEPEEDVEDEVMANVEEILG